ncbi:MAG: 30S ribosomal protein S14 [Actinomycetota bacterium]|nr:30S ribosomal protein S14 [Actinomycetota bacterium]
MAKRSKIVANDRRREIVARHAERRRELKRASVDMRLPAEQRRAAMAALHRLPRDVSPTRVRERDMVDGRPLSLMTSFGLSRIRSREMAHQGELPGITKSSW